jgi:hypothetical protein
LQKFRGWKQQRMALGNGSYSLNHHNPAAVHRTRARMIYQWLRNN